MDQNTMGQNLVFQDICAFLSVKVRVYVIHPFWSVKLRVYAPLSR